MCGIFGTISQNNSAPDLALVTKATRMLQHRGPDGEDYFHEGPLALGHRRLAIIDLSPKGIQPMTGFGTTITYNGEIYNYLELKKTLSQKGYTFSSQTDTEVVLAAYAEWGKDCVHHFNGMWAFAIYDKARQEVFCSRDRFGIKPFYYTSISNNFYFASEIKAFTVLPSWQKKINKKTAAAFLLEGKQHQTPETFFEGVFQLLPGHQLVYDLKKHTFQNTRYYALGNIPKAAYSQKAATAQFQNLFANAVALHLRSDVPVGTAFSGGLDSSAILATLYNNLQQEGTAIPSAIAYCAQGKIYDESPYIDFFQQKYPVKVHRISPNFSQLLNHLDSAILAQDEPLLSASLLAQYAVFQEAKTRGLKVMLDGQGADELLAGYGTYYRPFFRHLLKTRPLHLLPEFLGLLWYHRVPWEKLRLSQEGRKPVLGIRLNTVETSSVASLSFRSYMQEMIQRTHLPALLHFEDRNSMAHGIEARVPFLDFKLVEFCCSLAPEYHIYRGKRKILLRRALKDLLPKKILQRYDKMGFVTPQSEWMNQHPEQVLALLEEAAKVFPDIFAPEWLPWVKNVLAKKEKRYYPLLWRAITLGRWGFLYLSS